MPKVSIIMPCWNTERFIEDAIGSVLEQDHPNFELILVDDRSQDRSLDVARALVARTRDPRVKFVVRDVNGGVALSRNSGLLAATGDFVAFIDSDDRYRPQFLSRLLSEVASHPDVDIVGCRLTRVLADGTLAGPSKSSDGPRTLSGREAARLSLHDQVSCFLVEKLFRRSLFDELRCPEVTGYEDLVLSTLLYLKARNVRLIDDINYLYYMRPQSVTWSVMPSKTDIERAFAFLQEGLGDAATDRDMAAALRRRKVYMTIHLASKAALRRPADRLAQETIAYCREHVPLRDIPRILLLDPAMGLAALSMRVSSWLFSELYRYYARRTYGIG